MTGQTATRIALADLDDAAFVEAMKLATWKESRWDTFMDAAIICRTQEALRGLSAQLIVQLADDKADRDEEWLGRQKNLRNRINTRISQVNARVKDLNRAEAEAVTASGRKWSGFAERLAEAVESTPAAHVLDEVLLPDGQMSVRQWLAARRSKASTTEENR